MKIYRVVTSDGRDDIDCKTMEAAESALRERMGWSEVVCSDDFQVSGRSGERGNVLGVECYESQEECDEHSDGDPHAPRILIVRGDEAWAMGNDEDDADERADHIMDRERDERGSL